MAVPVFEPIIRAVWARVVPKEVLAAPSADARRQLTCKSTDVDSERSRRRGGEATTDCLRLDERGRVLDTRYRLVSRERDAEDRAKKSEPTSVFESQRRASQNMNLWQRVPQQTNPQSGSTSDNGGRGLAPRSLQDPGLGNSSYYWFRD